MATIPAGVPGGAVRDVEAAGMEAWDCDDDDVLDEKEGVDYVPDLTIFIRRAFEPKPFADSLRYRL
eukprot:CAMPEP_0172185552 /NCGR_PEP_ID=MMETSP1050-20130122/20238_1 /TAXON_ID=233186 /ORGANISM="Cryptomonas curvata, Strain CCAP979/52" /LENGTH=65 /DNA_ID=CAMNT_0012859561 /DNA_START=243 /DNA_END=438 /DNA_ORIENTATION=+